MKNLYLEVCKEEIKCALGLEDVELSDIEVEKLANKLHDSKEFDRAMAFVAEVAQVIVQERLQETPIQEEQNGQFSFIL